MFAGAHADLPARALKVPYPHTRGSQVDWTASGGWGAPTVCPLQSFSIHPAAQTLQYGAHCFEGMKCYAGVDGRLRLFRPELNMQRLLRSATRLALPGFDCTQLLECIKALLRCESRWVPRKPGFALYLRPTIIATTPFLGVGPPTDATLYVVLSPCGPYTPGPPRAVTLYLEEEVIRAAPGGVGQYKVGGNYAPTVAVGQAALRQHGATQVLYTFKPDNGPRVVSEGGAMNVFFVVRLPSDTSGGDGRDGRDPHVRELMTAPLDGTILPGVTRASILELAKQHSESGIEPGLRVSERPITVDELVEASQEGRLEEVFCTGTAAVVLPVASLIRQSGEHVHAHPFNPAPGEMLSTRLGAALADIQYGSGGASHHWQCPIDS